MPKGAYKKKVQPLAERFCLKVHKRGPDDCWPWTGARHPTGYGIIVSGEIGFAPKRAHRIAWELTNGPIPDGLCVLHRCDNPPCVNPAHLFLGTDADNVADMVKKGRQARGDRHRARLYPEKLARGESHSSSKLTEEQVREIRRIFIKSSRAFGALALARRFGVVDSTILRAIRKETWGHV